MRRKNKDRYVTILLDFCFITNSFFIMVRGLAYISLILSLAAFVFWNLIKGI